MFTWSKTPRQRRSVVAALLAVVMGAALPCLAQNPVDPTQSWVERSCEFVILTAPGGTPDDLGDNGIIVNCLDADGMPVADIPGSAFSLVQLDGPEVWLVSAEPTNDAGRTLLTGYPGDSYTLVHGSVGVNVQLGGEDVLLDNGGAGFPLELRSPDLNGDFVVNLSDVVIFASAFGCCEDTYECLRCDYDGDGCVSLADAAIFESYLGSGTKTDNPHPPRPPELARQDEQLFLGCIQPDLGTDTDPETIDNQVIALPGVPFYLRFVAKDFRELTGVDFEFGVPGDLVLLARNTVPAFPAEFPGPAGPGNERVIVTGDCATVEPLFVYEFLFLSATGGPYHVNQFPLVHARFVDCFYPPHESDACIGSPSPCDVSYVVPGLELFISCPAGDLDTSDTVTVVMRDQNGDGVPGLAAGDFRIFLEDERGSDRAYMVRFTPQAAETDANGELPFLFELRDSCRWDTCLDLIITVRYQSCDLSAKKRVRTINGVPAFSADEQADGVIDLADVGWWAMQEYTVNDCLALVRNYRCPVVTNHEIELIADHLGHSCEHHGHAAGSAAWLGRDASQRAESLQPHHRTEDRPAPRGGRRDVAHLRRVGSARRYRAPGSLASGAERLHLGRP